MLLFSENLKALREEKGLSQEELATKLNVVRQTVSKWEKGLSTPDAEMLLKLAEVLGTSVSVLVGEDAPNETIPQSDDKKPRKQLNVLEIVLLILGSPVWMSLLVSAVAVAVSLYVSWWAILVSLWAAFGSFVGGALGGIASGIMYICTGQTVQGFIMIAAALVSAGLAIFTFFGCKALTKCAVKLTQKLFKWLKNRFSKKEGAK